MRKYRIVEVALIHLEAFRAKQIFIHSTKQCKSKREEEATSWITAVQFFFSRLLATDDLLTNQIVSKQKYLI